MAGLVALLAEVIPANPADVRQPALFDACRARFSVRFKDEILPYRVSAIFVLPNEIIRLEAVPGTADGRSFDFSCPAGRLVRLTSYIWHWAAPGDKGLYRILAIAPSLADTIILNAFVMVPYNQLKDGFLNGYRIGRYPQVHFNKPAIYQPPRGFIELTRENEETPVSPHFSLGQFQCKSPAGYPRYLVLRERLVLKLELILEKANEKGYPCTTFAILSGYRTPWYNKKIGNVKYSRHVWGGAADIYIDENPKDGVMDDLNKDGKTDTRDAGVLYDIIDGMYGQPWYEAFVGGLGRYRQRKTHGPFVHVDVRGFRARWGD